MQLRSKETLVPPPRTEPANEDQAVAAVLPVDSEKNKENTSKSKRNKNTTNKQKPGSFVFDGERLSLRCCRGAAVLVRRIL